MKELGMMKIPYVDHFPGRITSMCKLDVIVNAIREKLTRQQLTLFKDNIFGHFLQCRSYPFSGVIVHNILRRQVSHGDGKGKDELWFHVGEHAQYIVLLDLKVVFIDKLYSLGFICKTSYTLAINCSNVQSFRTKNDVFFAFTYSVWPSANVSYQPS